MKEKATQNNLASVAEGLSSFKDLFTAKNVTTLASYVGNVATDSLETFKAARNNAKTTGKMLAHFLASKGHIFGNQTFSLIGFSLGS